MKKTLTFLLGLMLAATFSEAGDWSEYGGDSQRTCSSPDMLPSNLSLVWKKETHGHPKPAWKSEDRMVFDRAYYPVTGEGKVYFGSSSDGKIYALDANSGKEVWTFFTDSPVRLAPAYSNGRVYAISDDGFLYCFKAENGEVLWKKQGGPDPSLVLGNDRMVSRWPVRGGLALDGNQIYFGAGIWPSEGFFLYCLDAETGETRWLNSEAGGMEMDQPHGGARAKSGVVAQGYLAVAGEDLLVPSGRAVPAAFKREDGSFKYFHLQQNRRFGGSNLFVGKDFYCNNGAVFKRAGGELVGELGSSLVAGDEEGLFVVKQGHLQAYTSTPLITEKMVTDRKGHEVPGTVLNPPDWELDLSKWDICSIAKAPGALVLGLYDGRLAILDLSKRETVWEGGKLDGPPLSLCLSGGQVLVGTSLGTLYAFGETGGQPAQVHVADLNPAPYGENAEAARAAEEILATVGMSQGYCLDFGCGQGELAYELAKRSDLQILAVESDPAKVTAARAKLDSAGLYGTRVTVLERDLADTHLPDYFANLVVSGRSVTEGSSTVSRDHWFPYLRPYGGEGLVGRPGNMERTTRGELAGAGEWTHQYSDPANTICSGDSLVEGQLGMLWFRDADQEMPQRHGRGPAPLFYRGFMVVEGLHSLRGLDAYNGRTLWEIPLPRILEANNQDHLVGAAATGSNFCIDEGQVFLRSGPRCLKIDIASGNPLAEFEAPRVSEGTEEEEWGYLACVEGILFGSISDTSHIIKKAYRDSDMSELFSESKLFFAMDSETGKVLWQYRPKHSIRHNAIAIGKGKVFLIDRPQAVEDRPDSDLEARRGKPEGEPTPTPIPQEPGLLLALEARTGKEIWRRDADIYGTLLALSEGHDVLLMGYQFTRFRQSSERGGRLGAFVASSGEPMWDITEMRPKGYSPASRPVINGKTVYLEPSAYDLLTGEKLDFSMARSYGCGIITSSSHSMFFRSATLGYLDVGSATAETLNYGGIRPGCWINAIPAGGLLLMPDASAGCTCSYLNRASIALLPLASSGSGAKVK